MIGRGHYEGQIVAFQLKSGVRFERWTEETQEWQAVLAEGIRAAFEQYVCGIIERLLFVLVRSSWCDSCNTHKCEAHQGRREVV